MPRSRSRPYRAPPGKGRAPGRAAGGAPPRPLLPASHRIRYTVSMSACIGSQRNPSEMRHDRPKSAQLIRGLEEQLLRPEARTSAERLAALLADDFTEIGSSGRLRQAADHRPVAARGKARNATNIARFLRAMVGHRYRSRNLQHRREPNDPKLDLEIDRRTLANGISSGHKIWRFQ
jgi:hypothetical protein